jgi:hypothetical protein
MTVPGIGPIISSAMVAAIGTGDVFSKGRDFGAWLGLVPKQISTGDRTILGKSRGAASVRPRPREIAAKGGLPHTRVQESRLVNLAPKAPSSRSGLGTQSAPGPFLCASKKGDPCEPPPPSSLDFDGPASNFN